MQSEEILDELVEQTQEIGEFFGLTFEVGEEYWAIADARLSAFANEQMWAAIFEVIGYDPGGGEYASHVFVLGNCVQPRETIYLPNVSRVLLTTPNAWNKEVERGLARDGFSLLYRGRRHDFAPTLEELQSAGIELSHREIESGLLSPQQMLRYVCEIWDHPFWMSEDALRDLLDANALPFEWKYDRQTERSWYENEVGESIAPPLPSLALELVLQTRDWTHPRMGNSLDEWEISPRQAFATLAQTLATRDVAAWRAQNPAVFNSHWHNWADIEARNERLGAAAVGQARAAFRSYVMETVPPAARIEFLRQLRPTLETAPYFANNTEIMTIERDGENSVRLFRELKDDADLLLIMSQNDL